MRITERKIPLLKYLRWRRPLTEHPDFERGKLEIFVVQGGDAPGMRDQMDATVLGALFLARWADYSASYSENIEVISEPFNDAMWKNASKVYNEETLKECVGRAYKGTLIHGVVALCYDFVMDTDMRIGGNLMMHIGENLVLLVNGERRFISEKAREFYGIPDWDIVRNTFKEVLVLYLFKKFAETETVEAKPFKKVRLPEGDSLLVDSPLSIHYFDCAWFRQIVRNEGFMVSGHFRLQPYKRDGVWTRKLIYIEPFQKHGYVRRALKDIPENRDNT